MKFLKEDNNEVIKLIQRAYEGKGSLHDKIQILQNTRAKYHGNDEIQNNCNKYLDKLYDELAAQFKNNN